MIWDEKCERLTNRSQTVPENLFRSYNLNHKSVRRALSLNLSILYSPVVLLKIWFDYGRPIDTRF